MINIVQSLISWVDKRFYIFLFSVSVVIFILNYNSTVMEGIVPSYLDFKNIILSGFTQEAVDQARVPTFPMWGYGWILTITENRFAIFLFQIIIANISLIFLIKTLSKNDILSEVQLRYFKVLMLFAIPFFAINIALTPYGLAISFFIFSFIFFLKGYYEDRVMFFVVAGLFFGLTLNFRSDLIYFPMLLILIFIFLRQFKKLFKFLIPFIVASFVIVMPWGIYTKHITGNFLLSSTNSGHVFFIGLGQLPNNKWEIEPHDGDPRMAKEIEKYFGQQQSSLTYESDQFMKKLFVKEVKKEPLEYIKKCFYSFGRSLVDGAYSGQYYLLSEEYTKQGRTQGWNSYISWRSQLSSDPLILLNASPEYVLHIMISALTALIKLTSFLLLPLSIWFGIKTKNFLTLLVISIIAYQSSILVFAYNMTLYSTNVFLFYVLNIVLGATYLKKLMEKNTYE